MIDMTATIDPTGRNLTIGTDTIYCWRGVGASGLLDTATIRINDIDRPRRDGVIPGDDFLAGRLVSFELLLTEGDANEAAAAALTAAFGPSRTDLWLDVRWSGDPAEYSLRGRPRGCQIATNRQRWSAGILDARCSFMATDPVRYGPQDSLSISLATPGGGLVYPVVYPVVYGGSGGSGIGTATNAGTASVPWTATLNGPLLNPRLEHIDSGRFVRVLASIASGQTVVLDSSSGSVLLNGSAPRPSWVAPGSSWFELGPGDNGLRFTADSGTGTVDVVWRPGWA